MAGSSKRVKLDAEEKEIEDHLEEYVPVSEPRKRKLVQEFRRAARAGRSRVVSLRFDEQTLAKVRAEAAAEGLPYQTFIRSVLYRYVTGRLVDQKDVRIAARAPKEA